MLPPTSQPIDVEPIPPRYWWLKRILLASAVFVVLLVALRLWWGWEADRRLQAEIDRIIAAGEPIYPEDFDPKEKVPDDQNAAKLYQAAQDALILTPEQISAMGEMRSDAATVRRHPGLVRSIVEGNPQALELARRARHFPRADWGLRYRSPVINRATFGTYTGERQLGKLLYCAAVHHADAGNENEAVDALLDTLALSRCLQQQPTLMAQITAWGIDSGAIRGVEELVLVPRGGAADGLHPATGVQIRALLSALSDDAGFAEGMRQTWLAERMSHIDSVAGMDRGAASISTTFGPIAARPDLLWEAVYRPVFKLDMVRLSRQTHQRLETLQRSVYVPSTQQADVGGVFESALRPYSSILRGSQDHFERLYFRYLAWRRLAAVGLAIRLFCADHGHRPATLSELVPHYLQHVPNDPFVADGRSIAYLPEADPSMVYSIGTDGVDDGGRFVQRGGYASGYKLDFPFFLDGSPPSKEEDGEPPANASVETQKDPDDAEDGEGHGEKDQKREQEP